mmetsp:Transcript_62292/g.157429  ORF Transcript_62292/g.157429 Transcript_62292/m.157429 type:complete len:394 (-) Transcript_62292:112-1293(-)
MLIDSLMASIICINAVFIGIQMDHSNSDVGWTLMDVLFSSIFIAEIIFKVNLHGVRGHFLGHMWMMNCFDATLVILDVFQLLLVMLFPQVREAAEDMPSASLFRIVRLIKITRLLRVLQNEVFKDLLSMVQGILGGMTTLAWSMVLFFLVIYVMALLFREFFGRKQRENVFEFFNSVPRSMFTTFRCSFGDCSTAGGVPIFEYVNEYYGGAASIFYCLFVFGVTIGIFNVISAIFVESTMAAALSLQSSKKQQRLQDEKLWNSRITQLIRNLVEVSQHHKLTGKLSAEVEDIVQVDFPGSVLDEAVKLPAVQEALDDLDIDPADHRYLSDFLDPDNGGSVGVIDFIDGIRRLRGDPRRSDIVSIDLMVRSIQKVLGNMEAKISDIHEVISGSE